MSDESPAELKDLYYLDHFFEMLDFVVQHNRNLLDLSHLDFINHFRGTPQDGQCLFVRMANRKGSVFRLDQLAYDEISDLEKSIDQLRKGELVRDLTSNDYSELLHRFNRFELVELIKKLPFLLANFPQLGSASKKELISFILRTYEFDLVLTYAPPAISLNYVGELDYLIFLYFGSLHEGLTAFALRDLGIRKTRRGNQNFEARFSSRSIALAAFHYHTTRHQIRKADPGELIKIAGDASEWPEVEDPDVTTSRHRTINRLGRALERQGESERALSVYLLSDQFPSTERCARLYYQLGKKDQAKQYLLGLIDNPSSDEELIFGEDFYERKFKERKVGRLTEMLRNAEVLHLNETGRDKPEAAAVSYFEQSGAEAYHVENLVWSQLFGAVFWEALFEKEIHSDFDVMPPGLRSKNFYNKNKTYLEKQIAQVSVPGWIDRQISSATKKLEAVPNYLLDPNPDLFELTRRLVELAPEPAIQTILRELAQNFRTNRNGFPDLLVFENDTVRLIEIKAEGDQIQRNQLVQMERLRRAGFDVSVARIQWVVDPDQEYVVVDLETTGGNPALHRVTEIGAVKVQHGKIIDQWSSLLNPERTIPKNIVRLTGITDEMVATAPTFPEVAETFREFLGEAIFVAHRASFDFGFLKEEYRRLEEEFSVPTFCTVVQTRRYFPGLPSYGLANLTEHFGIPLESHHRALCDARATAELLIKINQQRKNAQENL